MHTLPHLSPERLAALADDAPTAMERAHLDGCAHCQREQRAHADLLALAGTERARIGPPATDWTAIAAGLRAEGMLRDGAPLQAPLSLVKPPREASSPSVAPAGRPPRATHVTIRVPRWAMQAAAALLLVAAGALAGRLSATASVPSVVAGIVPGQSSAILASDPAPVRFASREEAVRALQVAEVQYQRASEFLAQNDSVSAPAPEAQAADVYRARLAAFDGVVAATQQALYAAPADPVINRYYLATSAAREVALKQLNLVAPAGTQINRY